jgi:hypothetical protein
VKNEEILGRVVGERAFYVWKTKRLIGLDSSCEEIVTEGNLK